MSSENVYKRILDLLGSILKMLTDGVRDPERFADALQAVVDQARAKVEVYLNPVKRLTLDATDGTETLASARNTIFSGGVYDIDTSGAGGPTPQMSVVLYVQKENGEFADLFGSLGEKRKRWQESQVNQFYRQHRDELEQNGHENFFELEGGLIAQVKFKPDGNTRVRIARLSSKTRWWKDMNHQVFVLE